MYWETLQKIKIYLQQTRPLFQNGFLRLINEENKIKIMYKTNFWEFATKKEINLEEKTCFNAVQDFVLDCFFFFEWTGEKMNSEEISLLLWKTSEVVRARLFKIYKKLKAISDEWKFFLP